MKMKTKLFAITTLLLALAIAWSCNSPKATEPNESTDTETTSETEAVSETDFPALVGKWCDAHNTKDVGALANIYNQNVMFYGSPMDKNECIENKLAFFKKKPDFKQEATGEIAIENISANEVKCSFNKRVTVDGKTTDYPSYLHFRKTGDAKGKEDL